jgi:hypothetical protein
MPDLTGPAKTPQAYSQQLSVNQIFFGRKRVFVGATALDAHDGCGVVFPDLKIPSFPI